MTKEQEKTIKKIKRIIVLGKSEKNIGIPVYISELETVLSMLGEQDKIIDLLIKELYTKAHISTRCYLQTSTEECMKYKNCYECLKKHFENKERRNNGKGN